MSDSVAVATHLRDEPLSIDALLELDRHSGCGGLAMFAGTVRDHHESRSVVSLAYTAYRPVAERLIGEIEAAARTRFGVPYCRVQHRIGHLQIGDLAILCVVRAPHRAEAFEACRWTVDAVKHQVPIWKEEFYADGSSAFVQGCCIRPEEDGAKIGVRVDFPEAPPKIGVRVDFSRPVSKIDSDPNSRKTHSDPTFHR